MSGASTRSNSMVTPEMRVELLAGLQQLELPATPKQIDDLLAYLEMLARWNRTYNLTAVREPARMVSQHLLDSLAVLPSIERSALIGRRAASQAFALADVGSGAGLPSIPLAILRPDWDIASIETVEKKAAFQRQVKIDLKLARFSVRNVRVESIKDLQVDLVISRAFASLQDFAAWSGHLLHPDGLLCAMKGQMPGDEFGALADRWTMVACDALKVPSLDAERHVLFMRKL